MSQLAEIVHGYTEPVAGRGDSCWLINAHNVISGEGSKRW